MGFPAHFVIVGTVRRCQSRGVIEQFLDWIATNRTLINWLGATSVIMFVLTIMIVPILVVKMQPDYFLENRNEDLSIKAQHPVIRMIGKILKNLMGGLLVIAGIVLSVPLIPGQGFLTILIGLALMDFPGKRRLELWLVKRKPVTWAIQKLRARAHHPPLILPED